MQGEKYVEKILKYLDEGSLWKYFPKKTTREKIDLVFWRTHMLMFGNEIILMFLNEKPNTQVL